MMGKDEILIEFRRALDKAEQINILADLNAVAPRAIAKIIVNALGLCIRTHYCPDGSVSRMRICRESDKRELCRSQIEAIGLFLPYGPLYGKEAMIKPFAETK